MATVKFKVYGLDGHRQGHSFEPSYSYDFSCKQDGIRKITVENSDITGTNDYSLVTITRNSIDECYDEINGQVSDGIFENYNTGRVETVSEEE